MNMVVGVHPELIAKTSSCGHKYTFVLQMCINPQLRIVLNKSTNYSFMSNICLTLQCQAVLGNDIAFLRVKIFICG